MRQFVIEFGFIGVNRDDAEILLRTLGVKHLISAKGVWAILDNNSYFGPDQREYPACKLVTPQIDMSELPLLKNMMCRLYATGAIISPVEPFKIHFAKNYSEKCERRIIEKLVKDNRFLYTFLLYPRYFSLLTSDAKYSRLNSYEKLEHYKILVDTIDDEMKCQAIEGLIANILLYGSDSLEQIDL